MRILLGWSGSKSKNIAEALRNWLPCVIQAVEPWMSEHDIGAGSRWGSDLADQLEHVQFGIFCLTTENSSSPWIHFEAGALSKITNKGSVCPYLFDLEPSDVNGPLSQFMAVKSDESGTKKLLHTINKSMGGNSLPFEMINKSFEVFWPELKTRLSDIHENYFTSINPKKSSDVILEETLDTARELSRIITELKHTGAISTKEKFTVIGLQNENASFVLDEYEIRLIKDMTLLYKKVEKLVIDVEEYNNKHTYAPSLLEMRNALDHLMRLFAAKFGLKDNVDDLYGEENIIKAMEHIYRAGMDSLDYLSVEIRSDIENHVESYSTSTISNVIPDYFSNIRPDIIGISDTISDIRASKDLDFTKGVDIDIYINAIERLKKHHLEVIRRINELNEY